MPVIQETVFKDGVSGKAVELVVCPCGNNVFYVTNANERFCVCCKMTGEESQKAIDDAVALQNEKQTEVLNANPI